MTEKGSTKQEILHVSLDLFSTQGYIGFVFAGEEYRDKRLSQQLIGHAIDYIKNIGYHRAYIVSDHENLYDKYVFHIIDRKIAPWGSEEKIYMREF